MKRLPIILLCLFSAWACSIQNPKAENGMVSLSITKGTGSFVNPGTKAAEEAPGTFQVLTLDEAMQPVEQASGTYEQVKGTYQVSVGTYTTSACNISPEEAVTDWGSIRYAGSQTYTVVGGETTMVSFLCSMVNAKVSISYDHTFTDQFTEFAVDIYNSRSRSCTFPATATFEAPIAFYNIEDGKDLTLRITGKKDEQYCEFFNSISISAQTWHRITIKALTIQGEAGFTVTADDDIVSLDNTLTVDPYGK